MVDVRGNDRAATGHLVSHELGRDHPRNVGTPGKPRMLLHAPAMAVLGCSLGLRVMRLVLADGDKLHFRCDDAFAGVVELCDVLPLFRAQGFADVLKAKFG